MFLINFGRIQKKMKKYLKSQVNKLEPIVKNWKHLIGFT